MKILVFSLGPIFPDYVHGGSQKVLREILEHLGKKEHKVHVFCVRRDDNSQPFELFSNVEVYPTLRFKQTFPSSYYTPPYHLASIIETLHHEIQKHEVFYVHDAGMNFPSLTVDIPTVVSLRDFLYPETLVGVFNFERDRLIVNSTITRESVLATLGRLRPSLEERIEVIENGINLDLFQRQDSRRITQLIPLAPGDIPLLYPHRPEPSKGIFDCLTVVKRLRAKGLESVKLLVPNYIDSKVSRELAPHYGEIERAAREQGIRKQILFHDWIPYESMPAYYSLGGVSLNIGTFIESFGSNTALEALACGVYPVVTRVGAYRTTLPDELLEKVDPGDVDRIEKNIIDILEGEKSVPSNIRQYIHERFNYQRMLDRYEEIITGTRILPLLPTRLPQTSLHQSSFRLAPWCYISEKGIYNDYRYQYSDRDSFYVFLKERGGEFHAQDAITGGIPLERIQQELDDGTITLTHAKLH